MGIEFSPKVLCTVKLSRRLFPNQARHNLDTLITVHGLQVANRHRALDDARATVDVLHGIFERLGTFGVATLGELTNFKRKRERKPLD